jgi:hypothetical protein
MAEEKQIVFKIDADGNAAVKEIDKITDAVGDIKPASENATKSVGGISKGFKGLGVAMKAAGIGLIIGALTSMKEIFSENQRVVDAFSTVFETFSIVVNQVVTAFINVYDAVAKSSENFNGLKAVLSGLLTIAVTPLKVAFYGIKLGLQEAQLVWEKSFFGDKDPETIKTLNAEILETKIRIAEVGIEAINAGKDVISNFGDAVGEVVNIGKLAGEELSKVSISAAYEQAKVNVELKNSAELAAAQQSRLVEQYDRQAEKLRQVRDEERNTIAQRQEANENLLKVLDEQEKAMLAQADLQIAAAQNEVDKNNNIENQIALIDALANREGVLAQIEGFRSEQLANDLALKREEIELNQTISDAEKERQLAKLAFDEEQALTEADKLVKQRERLDLENQIILEDLQRKREIYAEGTQARVDAEQEYKTRKEEIDREILENEKKSDKEKEQSARALEESKLAIASTGLDVLGSLAKKGSKLAKGVAVAQALMNTYQGITAALAAPSTIPEPFGFALKLANAAAVGVTGLLNVKKIVATNEMGTGGANAGGGASTPSAPSFNLVGQTGTSQLAQSLGQNEQQPVQAYVVASQVTTQQSFDNNIVETATLG